MAKFEILAGTTSKLLKIFIQNNSVTTGAGLTGLVFNTAGLTAYYIREGASSTTSIPLVTAVVGTFTSGGFIAVDATNMPGVYEIGIPNAALAAGAKSVLIYIQGATNMAPVLAEVELTAVDNQSTSYGLALAKTTNITGFNDIAATAIVSSGAIATSSGAVSAVTNLTNAPTAGDFTAAMKTSLNAATVNVNGTTDLTEAYAAQGASLTLSSALYGITQQLGQMSISGTLMTVKKRDGATTAKTYNLNDALQPTAISEAS